MHALAIGYSPAYLTENADGIRRDWPRIPLPDKRKMLEASAGLGEQIAELLDTEANTVGVTHGKISPIFETIGLDHQALAEASLTQETILAITAGWGHFAKEGVTMPGKGNITERQYDQAETQAMDAEASARGMSPKEIRSLLGEKTCDVYLNDTAFWRNIPLNVWQYYIAGIKSNT